MAESDMTAQEWNKKGDKEFIHGKWSKAIISHYKKAIKLATNDTGKGLYYDNRAAAYFERDDYDKVNKDCNKLEKFEQAYQNVDIIISSCSNNTIPQHIRKQFCEISDKHIKNKATQ